jgi:hypothetical protein
MQPPLHAFVCNSNVVCKLVYQCVINEVKLTCELLISCGAGVFAEEFG